MIYILTRLQGLGFATKDLPNMKFCEFVARRFCTRILSHCSCTYSPAGHGPSSGNLHHQSPAHIVGYHGWRMAFWIKCCLIGRPTWGACRVCRLAAYNLRDMSRRLSLRVGMGPGMVTHNYSYTCYTCNYNLAVDPAA